MLSSLMRFMGKTPIQATSTGSDTTLVDTSTSSTFSTSSTASNQSSHAPAVLVNTGHPDLVANWTTGKRLWPHLFDGVRGNVSARDVVLGDFIAAGGYSSVFRGVWQRDVEVGIKILSNPRWERNFAGELVTWATIPPHPNVLRLLGVCFDSWQPFMISPLMRNGNLFEYLARFKPGPRDKVRLMIEIAKGLRHLHQNQIAHANIHPGLIVIDDQGHAMVSSFGFAYDERVPYVSEGINEFVTDQKGYLGRLWKDVNDDRVRDRAVAKDSIDFAKTCIKIWCDSTSMKRLLDNGTAPDSLVDLIRRCEDVGRVDGAVPPLFDEIIDGLHRIMADLIATPGQQPIDTPWIQEEHVTFIELIGRGGYGEVYLGTWDGKEVALKKVFRGDMGRDLYTAFAAEIEIWSGLKHENVLRLSGACLTTAFPFIVSPFMKYGTALSYLRSVPTTTYQRIKLMLDIARGMAYLHSVGLVHADLKASNVLVADDGTGLVCDFGYAKLESATRQKGADPSERVGTPRWMPPERLLEHTSNKEGDVYAMGMTAYEIWTLERPFGDVPDARLWSRIIDGDLRPCCDSTSVAMPAQLKSLIERCWAPEPKDRPSFEVVEQELQEILFVCPTDIPMPQEPRAVETITAKVAVKRTKRDELNLNVGDVIKVLGRFAGGLEFGTLTTTEKGGFYVRTAVE